MYFFYLFKFSDISYQALGSESGMLIVSQLKLLPSTESLAFYRNVHFIAL